MPPLPMHGISSVFCTEKGEPQSAFAELVRTADLDPDNLDASLKTAEFYLWGRKTEECRKLIEEYCQKTPTIAIASHC